jgi:hypothetical protein
MMAGGAGLMLATVATTASAEPLAPEPQQGALPQLQDTVGAALGTLAVTPVSSVPIPAAPTPTPAPAPSPAAPAPRPQPADQLDAWINEAITVLQAHGYSSDELTASDIRLIIVHESGGNPYAVNGWDSNASGGTPSKGLMQIITPTFNAWALPGYGNIYNPVDNIIAGVRYIIADYGSVHQAPGIVSLSLGDGYRGY